MLVLSRKVGERLIMGKNGEIILQLLEVEGHKIRIGIEAPADVPIFREEVWKRINEKPVES